MTSYELWVWIPSLETWDMVYKAWTPGVTYQYMLDCKENDRLAGITNHYEIRETTGDQDAAAP